MSVLTAVTAASVISSWLNIILTLVSAFVGLIFLGKFWGFLRTVLLDVIQVRASWRQSQLDYEQNSMRLELYRGEAKLLLRDQRAALTKQLLKDFQTE